MTPRRPVARALLLALVFLAIIGASVGVVGGWYIAGLGGDNGGGGNNAGGGTTRTQSPGPDQSPDQKPDQPQDRRCPDVTQQAAAAAGARGELVVELYIRTGNSQVWICRDRADRLWYQGNRHRGSPTDQLPAATSNDTLFLSTVEHAEDGSYVATNATDSGVTKYVISRTRLLIDNPGDGSDYPEPAIAEYTYPRS